MEEIKTWEMAKTGGYTSYLEALKYA